MPERKCRFEIKCCRALAAEFNEIQHIAVAVNQIFRNRLHNTATAGEDNLRHLHRRQHHHQPDHQIKET